MGKYCPRCKSEHIIKIVPAKSIVIPEVRKEIENGTARASCGCVGHFWGEEYECRDCGFHWDPLIEKGMAEQE